jgi:hypothetical protein
MNRSPDAVQSDGCVFRIGRGDNDAGRLLLLKKVLCGLVKGNAKSVRYGFSGRIRVGNGDERARLVRANEFRMLRAHEADPDDSQSYALHYINLLMDIKANKPIVQVPDRKALLKFSNPVIQKAQVV